jgi:hypothetical protein
MSFLAPLYLLGGLAVTLPILLHLIRRTPRGRQTFSSLMFLTPSPPRITRRSRIEHWVLLALRAIAIGLLAMAFARPFLRASASLLLDRGPGRKVAVLIDTSASLRRSDLWKRAVAQAEKTINDLGPNDVAALYRFDSKLEPVIGFPELTVDPQAHRNLLINALREISPSWQSTNLGQALTTVADLLVSSRREGGEDHSGQIVVVSDLQQGSDLSALQGYEWPTEVMLTLAPVQLPSSNNASARVLNNIAEIDLRGRVSNSGDSTVEEFRVGWRGKSGDLQAAASAYVPAGQARIVKLEERPADADRLQLTGDGEDFDNQFFVGPMIQRRFDVLFLGSDTADDPRGLRYFLARVWEETPRRKVTIRDLPPQEPLVILTGQTPALIVSNGLSQTHRESLQQHLNTGGVALVLASDEGAAHDLTTFLAGVQLAAARLTGDGRLDATADLSSSAETRVDKPPVAPQETTFAMLSDIDFQHPVFAAFSDPRFGDFTKVRFWNHQRFELQPAAKARVLARFDDGVPALWEQPVGKGRMFVFASSWRPADSQLALSSKFVPLLSSLLNHAAGDGPEVFSGITVGDEVAMPTASDDADRIVVTPDGREMKLDKGAKAFTATDWPGIYHLKQGNNTQPFAVNLASMESDTSPLPPERLEQLGVRLGNLPTPADQAERERQLRDVELESRQKLWQWLIVLTLIVLGIETLVAARATHKQQLASQEPATLPS